MPGREWIRLAWLLSGFLFSFAAMADASVDGDLEAAIGLYRAEGAAHALSEFERLGERFEKEGDRANGALATRYIGEGYWQMGDYERSRTHLDAALAAMRDLDDPAGEGRVLNVLGLLEWDLGNYDLAIDRFDQASRIAVDIDDHRLAGSSLNNRSLVYDELGDYRSSLEGYRQALRWYEGADFPRGEGDTLGNIGGVSLLLGRYPEAISYYQRALAISEELQSRAAMSLDHGNLGYCYLGLGRTDMALDHFEQALALARDAGMRKEEALWLRGKGNALIRKGRPDLSLESHRAALALYEDIGAEGLLLDSLHDLGRLFLSLGDLAMAGDYFRQAIDKAREIGLAQSVTNNLLALGDLRLRQELLEEAASLYAEALDRANTAGELSYQSSSLVRLAHLNRELGQFDRAEEFANGALEVGMASSAEPVVSEARFALGEIYLARGEPGQALEHYDGALAVEDLSAELSWQLHFGKALALEQQDSPQAAIGELLTAIRYIESVRNRLQEDRFKAGYLQDKYRVYVELVRLQQDLGLLRDAFGTAERLRAMAFLEQVEKTGPIALDSMDRETEIALRERVRQLRRALETEQDLQGSQRRQVAIETFSDELHQAESEYQAFLNDIRGRSIAGSVVQVPSVPDIQSRLGVDEVLVEYVVGEYGLTIFALRPEGIAAFRREVRRIDLESKVRLVRELIQQPESDAWEAPSASLAGLLLGPLSAAGLLEDADHLFVVPHGILNFLPFSVLSAGDGAGDGMLIERYSLAYLPAAAMLVRRPPGVDTPGSLLAMAPARSGLAYALREARSISGIFGPSSLLLSGAGATEGAFKEKASSFEILHLSTHGYFNPDNPLLSGLELEADADNDGLLEVHEILSLSLNAGLVTLSACESGMGSGLLERLPAGDDFVGLARAFLLAGSRSVLATLWPVDDRSTVELMEGFYRGLGRSTDGFAQARALAQAQREMLRSAEHKHPYYWAPFVLAGQKAAGLAPQIDETRKNT